MTELLLLHHAQGLTSGVVRFADRLRAAGHTVHTPDCFDGRTFDSLDDGIAYAREVGFGAVQQRGIAAAEGLAGDVVYAGFSMGVMAAQQLAQTRPGARGALFFESCLPPAEFGSAWPATVPVQVHGMAEDPIFAGEGDLDAARELVEQAEDGALFLYPGSVHLFADDTLPTYDRAAAEALTERVLAFLARV
ncbi:dienelactone hydrolase family protein [Intrasporangium calvum]|uniref:Dienelactone hydrolase family protein n=1 Tax=Intrasporangium calvum TaxID=53358 RepID=A0ABT5GKB7_9MICO|nr:dienelactone hydrolase family protein [Intrasporangium calvum]MDC5698663.1 dienelactone hydrolase family protein [Intrasporangium calvum]